MAEEDWAADSAGSGCVAWSVIECLIVELATRRCYPGTPAQIADMVEIMFDQLVERVPGQGRRGAPGCNYRWKFQVSAEDPLDTAAPHLPK